MPARAVAGLAVLLLYVASAAAEDRINKPPRDDDVMARVNGTTIYRKDVKDIVQSILVMQDTQPDAATVTKLADDALDSLIALGVAVSGKPGTRHQGQRRRRRRRDQPQQEPLPRHADVPGSAEGHVA